MSRYIKSLNLYLYINVKIVKFFNTEKTNFSLVEIKISKMETEKENSWSRIELT